MQNHSGSDNFHACLIAGTHSGAGKTLWTLALSRLARRKGLTVQPYKAGPDYIDTGFHHAVAAPRKSRNLDLFLLSEKEVKKIFQTHAQESNFAIVEGVMGLFDGVTPLGEGETAKLAKLLKLPVLLVVDGASYASSLAALVLGFQKMDPDLNLAGVLINRLQSDGHFDWLKKSVEGKTGVPCLGWLPSEETFSIPERHLGLTTAVEMPGWMQKIENAADQLEKSLDWNHFLKVTKAERPALDVIASPGGAKQSQSLGIASSAAPPRNDKSITACSIGVAYDEAFSFYYEDNLDYLRTAGARLVFFSPLHDAGLPENLDLLYFGGGFPEMHATGLSQNSKMMQSIRDFRQNEGFIYAECGGLIYLTEAFFDKSGKQFPLAGLIPGRIRMTGKLQHFGYHEMTGVCDSFLFQKGQKLRSHEFHYSIWENSGLESPVYKIGERLEGWAQDRLVASYQHLHFGTDPEMAKRLVASIEKSHV